MAAPLTVEQLVELIRKSNLIEPERLDSFLHEWDNPEASAADVAQALIDQGLLTHFHREQLLQGKWRGYTIGKYRVLERLGVGGMGSVYLCEHLKMKHKVAVKVLPTSKNNDPAALGRFYREARAAGVLDHPNLVRAHDVDQDGELHYLVMDYVDGVNLQHLVSRITGPLPIDRACHYIHQAAQGLQHAYAQGLIHRDIKPANLLLDRQGIIRVLDLGLARFYEDNKDLLTLKYDDNNVLGTADYVSPEQAMDSHDVDIRTDVYSLGATFYFLLTGQPLFPEGRVAQKLIWHKDRKPTPIRQLRPEIPKELAAVIERMLAKERDARYSNPAEVAAALEPFVQEPIDPPDETEIPLLCRAVRGSLGDGASGARTPPRLIPEVVRGGASARRPAAARAGARGAVASPANTASAGHATPRNLTDEESTARVPAALEATPRSAPSVPAPPQPRRSRVERLLSLTVVLLLGSTAGYFLRLSILGKPAPEQDGAREPRTLVVDRSGSGTTYPSITAALDLAKPGDTVEVRADTWDEVLRLERVGAGQGVTLVGRASEGKPVLWQPPAGADLASLIYLSATAGLRLQNFQIDGRDAVQHLVTITGPCPGLTLEDLTLQGFRTSGVRLTGAVGEEQEPVRLLRLRLAPAHDVEAGIAFDSLPDQPSKWVTLRDCELGSHCQAGVIVTGPTVEVEIGRCQLAGVRDGVHCRKGAFPTPVQLTLAGNTFREVTGAALHFEAPPPVEGSRITLVDNRFEHVRFLGHTDGFRAEPIRSPAVWVWSSEATGAPAKLYLRKRFTLETAPTRAVLSVTADQSFVAWINGQQVGQGSYSETSRHVGAFDVARHLQQGDNVLAVEATGGRRCGLLAQLDDNASGVFTRTLASDTTWKVARVAPPGWQAFAFDDLGWKPAALAAEGKVEPAWQGLLWDAVVQEQFKYQAGRVFPPPTGNERDAESIEGFPRFEATVKK